MAVTKSSTPSSPIKAPFLHAAIAGSCSPFNACVERSVVSAAREESERGWQRSWQRETGREAETEKRAGERETEGEDEREA